MGETALFIPLKTKWFEAFSSGEKITELRPYGKRWNEKTCRVSRAVVLSKGYGKKHRLYGRVTSFRRMPFAELNAADKAATLEVYGNEIDIAQIGVSDLSLSDQGEKS
jgi:hypothetical protein